MKWQQNQSSSCQAICACVVLRFFSNYQKRALRRAISNLIFMVIALMQTGIAFGAGERFLGVQVADHEQGVIIQQVVTDSPATQVIDISTGQDMSLEPGDVIQIVNRVNVSTASQFVELIRTGPPVALIRVLDARNYLFRDIAAGVGPSNEIAAYLNQESPNLEDRENAYTPPSSTHQSQGMSEAQRRAKIQMLDTQISMLDRKIKDQERSNRQYKELGDKHPGATNMMLQQSALRLLQTYENQKMKLEMQKSRLESGR